MLAQVITGPWISDDCDLKYILEHCMVSDTKSDNLHTFHIVAQEFESDLVRDDQY